MDGGDGDDFMVARGGSLEGWGDTMIGGSGADHMVGGKLPDTFIPGPGRDFVEGREDEAGRDEVDFQTAVRGVTVDLARGFARGQGYDRLMNVESVRGSPYSDLLLGNDNANSLLDTPGDGASGEDVMRGRGGRDEIWGGNAHDRLYGGSGDDSLGGGLGHDEAYGSTGGDVFWMKDGLRDVVRGGDGRDLAERDRTVDRVRSIEKFI